jgi:hypothetical protein
MRYGLSSVKRDNLRAISYFRCGVADAQAISVKIYYKFQTKNTYYCLRKQSCLFVDSRKTELRARKHIGHVAHFLFQIM